MVIKVLRPQIKLADWESLKATGFLIGDGFNAAGFP
jgi:hypothetical protein